MHYVRASKKAHHYVVATISGDKFTAEAYDTSNNMFDSVTTGPRASELPPPPPINFERRLPDAKWTTGPVTVIESRDASGRVTPAPAYVEEAPLSDSTAKSTAPGLHGRGSRYSDNAKADARIRFTPTLPASGTYLVSVTLPQTASAEAPNTLFEVASPGSELVRGRLPLTAGHAGNTWYDVGLLKLAPGATITLIEAEEEPDRFFSDAVRFTLMNPN